MLFTVSLDQPPTELYAYAYSTTTIAVSWSPISFETLLGYVIFYAPLAPSAQTRKRRSLVVSSELNVTITSPEQNSTFLIGLNQFYNYSVQVAGFTQSKIGPRTGAVFVVTNQTGMWHHKPLVTKFKICLRNAGLCLQQLLIFRNFFGYKMLTTWCCQTCSYITMNQTEKEWSNCKSWVRFGSVCKRWLSFLLVLFFGLIRLSNGLPSSHKTTHFCNNSRSNWIPQGSLQSPYEWLSVQWGGETTHLPFF